MLGSRALRVHVVEIQSPRKLRVASPSIAHRSKCLRRSKVQLHTGLEYLRVVVIDQLLIAVGISVHPDENMIYHRADLWVDIPVEAEREILLLTSGDV